MAQYRPPLELLLCDGDNPTAWIRWATHNLLTSWTDTPLPGCPFLPTIRHTSIRPPPSGHAIPTMIARRWTCHPLTYHHPRSLLHSQMGSLPHSSLPHTCLQYMSPCRHYYHSHLHPPSYSHHQVHLEPDWSPTYLHKVSLKGPNTIEW